MALLLLLLQAEFVQCIEKFDWFGRHCSQERVELYVGFYWKFLDSHKFFAVDFVNVCSRFAVSSVMKGSKNCS